MRYLAGLLLTVLLAVGVVACSSSEPLAVQFTLPQEFGVLPFVATGPAADEGIVCPEGSMDTVRLESVDGEELTDEEWGGVFEAAAESGSVAEVVAILEWTCGDGSGGFTMEHQNRFDFATFGFEGRHDVGTWQISEGTGSYGDLTGSGDVTLDFDGGLATYAGDIQS